MTEVKKKRGRPRKVEQPKEEMEALTPEIVDEVSQPPPTEPIWIKVKARIPLWLELHFACIQGKERESFQEYLISLNRAINATLQLTDTEPTFEVMG